MNIDVWFTSDLHFSHNNVIKYCNRPFGSVEEMNEALVANWNSVVKPGDAVFCLGDLSLSFRPIEQYSKRLNGVKYLVPGNHDWCHPYNKKARTVEKRHNQMVKYGEYGWIILPTQTFIMVGNSPVDMSHLPYTTTGDIRETVDKYEKHRPVDNGRYLLCGHVHEKWKTNGRMINVGVDVWDYKPVHMSEVQKLIT